MADMWEQVRFCPKCDFAVSVDQITQMVIDPKCPRCEEFQFSEFLKRPVPEEAVDV
jgi:uncharacterized paraquat-inducible protein A